MTLSCELLILIWCIRAINCNSTTFAFYFQVWCGKKPCLLHKHWDNSNYQCPMGQECQEKYMKCFQPPCTEWGECSASEPLPANIKCLPNSGYLDNDCARITLIFNGNKVPQVRTELLMKNGNICRDIFHVKTWKINVSNNSLQLLLNFIFRLFCWYKLSV